MKQKTYLGASCHVCGNNERYLLTHRCAPCKRYAALKYYEANREKMLPKMREHRLQTLEQRRKTARAYYLADKEYFAQKRREQLAKIRKADSVDKPCSEK